MARSTSGIAGINPSLVDRELDRFLLEKRSAYRNGIGVRLGCSRCACCWLGLARPHAHYATQMGVRPASDRVVALHDSDSWTFPLEFSVAAVFSFGPGNLCRGGVGTAAGITDPGYSSARSHCTDSPSDASLAYRWLLRFAADVALTRARGDLVTFRALAA